MKKKYTGLIILMVICHILPWAALVGGVAVVNHIAKTGDLYDAAMQIPDSILDVMYKTDYFSYRKTSDGKYKLTGIQVMDLDETNHLVKIKYISFRIPSRYKGKPVVEIGAGVFAFTRSLETVTLSNNIKTIGDAAFSDCYSLKTINFPRSISHIGERAFKSTALTEVNLSGDIKTIDINAFAYCSKLERVSIKGKNVVIKAQAFDGCTSLKEVSLDGVKTIGDRVFASCKKPRTVTMTNDVKSIGNEAFWGCIQLERINFLGTAEEWEAIDKGENWVSSVSFSVYCSDGTVIEY